MSADDRVSRARALGIATFVATGVALATLAGAFIVYLYPVPPEVFHFALWGPLVLGLASLIAYRRVPRGARARARIARAAFGAGFLPLLAFVLTLAWALLALRNLGA